MEVDLKGLARDHGFDFAIQVRHGHGTAPLLTVLTGVRVRAAAGPIVGGLGGSRHLGRFVEPIAALAELVTGIGLAGARSSAHAGDDQLPALQNR